MDQKKQQHVFSKCKKSLLNETYQLETPLPKAEDSMVWIGMRGKMHQRNVDVETSLRFGQHTSCTMYERR